MIYPVVHNGRGPYHLFNLEAGLTICGILAPGLHSRNDDASLSEDGLLYNSHFGERWPENLVHFCKKCVNRSSIDVGKTNTLYKKIFCKKVI